MPRCDLRFRRITHLLPSSWSRMAARAHGQASSGKQQTRGRSCISRTSKELHPQLVRAQLAQRSRENHRRSCAGFSKPSNKHRYPRGWLLVARASRSLMGRRGSRGRAAGVRGRNCSRARCADYVHERRRASAGEHSIVGNPRHTQYRASEASGAPLRVRAACLVWQQPSHGLRLSRSARARLPSSAPDATAAARAPGPAISPGAPPPCARAGLTAGLSRATLSWQDAETEPLAKDG